MIDLYLLKMDCMMEVESMVENPIEIMHARPNKFACKKVASAATYGANQVNTSLVFLIVKIFR